MTQTISQLRACDALEACRALGRMQGAKGGDVVKGFPSLIRINGLLGALAFAIAKREGYEKLADGVAAHLRRCDIANASSGPELIEFLAKSDSRALARATTETLAFLNFVKRFYGNVP